MLKYIDIERIGNPENITLFDYPEDEVVIEEKVDGGNGCFFIENGEIHVCSRNRDLTEEKDQKVFINQRKELLRMLDKNKINPDFYYYIEWMQKHTIFYGDHDKIPVAIGLDIKPKMGAFGRPPLFLNRKAKEIEFNKLGIPVVPLIWYGKIKDLTEKKIEELLKLESGVTNYVGKNSGI